jgi:glycosyltransferase involved in cell wall biosynthesis
MGIKMKILYLKDAFEPKYSMRDDVQITLRSKKKGHDVTVMTSKLDLDLNPQSKSYFEIQNKFMEGVKILRCKGFKSPLISFCPYVPNKSILGEYDIIHAHNIGSYSSFLAGAIKLTKKVPMILKSDLSMTFFERLRINYFLRKVVLKPFHLADAITAFTTIEKDFLIELGVPAEKIWIIPIGINYEEFSNSKTDNKNLITIGYMGRFTTQKGIHNIIGHLKMIMHDFQVKVLFTGQKSDIKYAENVITELEKYNEFEYSGFIKSSKDFYSQVDIVLVPSLWETGSIVTLEAMAAGKAVIASDINPHREYIGHGVNGFLAKDSEDFYRYCKELICNEELRQMLGRNAQRKAKEYDWESVFMKVEEMYKHINNRGE